MSSEKITGFVHLEVILPLSRTNTPKKGKLRIMSSEGFGMGEVDVKVLTRETNFILKALQCFKNKIVEVVTGAYYQTIGEHVIKVEKASLITASEKLRNALGLNDLGKKNVIELLKDAVELPFPSKPTKAAPKPDDAITQTERFEKFIQLFNSENKKEGVDILRQLAEEKFIPAQAALGALCWEENSGYYDREKAIILLNSAAQAGDESAIDLIKKHQGALLYNPTTKAFLKLGSFPPPPQKN